MLKFIRSYYYIDVGFHASQSKIRRTIAAVLMLPLTVPALRGYSKSISFELYGLYLNFFFSRRMKNVAVKGSNSKDLT